MHHLENAEMHTQAWPVQEAHQELEHAGLADSAVLLSMTGEVSERAQAEEHDWLGCARGEDVDKRLDEA